MGWGQVCVDPQVYAGPLRCMQEPSGVNVWTLRCGQGPSAVFGGPLGYVQGPAGVQQLLPTSQSERPSSVLRE